MENNKLEIKIKHVDKDNNDGMLYWYLKTMTNTSAKGIFISTCLQI